MSYSIDEVHYLIAHNADITCHLATRSFAPRDALTDATYLREHLGEYGRAAMELGRARHTAARKQLPADWIVCHESAQQATPLPVARVRAARLARTLGPGARIHDITCSIGTEGHALVAAGLQYFGSDLDPSRVIMARHNLSATFPTANAANKPQPVWGFHIADARHPATIPGAADAIIADPARRHQGRRITNPDELLPPLATIIATYPRTPMAIKCAPGIDFTGWGPACTARHSLTDSTAKLSSSATAPWTSSPTVTIRGPTLRWGSPVPTSSTPMGRSFAPGWCATTPIGKTCGFWMSGLLTSRVIGFRRA